MSVSNTTKRVKEIHRKFSSEEKIRIVLDGLRGESCRPLGTIVRDKSDRFRPTAVIRKIVPSLFNR